MALASLDPLRRVNAEGIKTLLNTFRNGSNNNEKQFIIDQFEIYQTLKDYELPLTDKLQ